MKDRPYWFPVRPARNGWGWGLPIVWQGWVAGLIYFATLIGGIVFLVPSGQLIVIAFICIWYALFLGLMFWKGEPQSRRDNRSP